jgi:hypothetical protein
MEGAPSRGSTDREAKRDAMTRIMEVLMGLRIPTCRAASIPTPRLGKFHWCEPAPEAFRTEAVEEVRAPARFEIVERLSRETLSIYWSDARKERYADQLWSLSVRVHTRLAS